MLLLTIWVVAMVTWGLQSKDTNVELDSLLQIMDVYIRYYT